MKDATPSPRGRRAARARSARLCPTVEVLEERRLFSVNLAEAEPNNTIGAANNIQRVPDAHVIVSGKVNATGDRDWFKLRLKAGDVLGAALKGKGGLNPSIRLVNAAGELMIANDDSQGAGENLPPGSPLPHDVSSATDPEIYYVIAKPGTYGIEVTASADASTGKYSLDMVVTRPALEKQPVGTRQILFLDFNGATVNFNHFATKVDAGVAHLSPLSHFLPDWGLTARDENAIIDGVIAKMKDKLSTYVRTHGRNGDFARTGVPGQFDIEIRNSRDNPDDFGKNPFESRVVIGGTAAQAGFPPAFQALAQSIDVGNLKTDDEAVLTLDFLAGAMQALPTRPPRTAVDFLSEAIGTIAAHEAGHLFGCFHTDQSSADLFAGKHNLMDPAEIVAVGPDFIYGTKDDVNLQLGVDKYNEGEYFRGLDDTLDTVAFGLSTGARRAKNVAFSVDATGVLTRTDGNTGVFALSGVASEVGRVTGETVNHIRGDGTHQDGTFSLKDAAGNQLFCSYQVTTEGTSLVGHYTVERGTGRFAGAKGGGKVIVGFTDVPGMVTVTLAGELSR